MRQKYLIGAVFAAVALSASYLQFRHEVPSTRSPGSQAAHSISPASLAGESQSDRRDVETQTLREIQGELIVLKNELGALKSAISSMRSTVSDGVPGEITQTGEEELVPTAAQIAEWRQAVEEQGKRAQAEHEQRLDRLESRFSAESLDRDWALEKSQVVRTALDAFAKTTKTATSAQSMECRSSMCRIEMEFDSEEARNDFDLHLAQSVASQLPSMDIKQEAVGNGIKVTYFLKGVAG